MISVPQYSGSKIKFIQLSRVTPLQLVAVVVSDNNVIRNQIINLDEEMDDQTILKLNLLLNTNLNGVPIQDINLGMIAALVTKSMANGGEDRDIQVYIGDESNVENMKDCSVVTATYELGEGMQGTIGIIGPKRMDYEHVMKTLKILQGELDAIYNKEPKE